MGKWEVAKSAIKYITGKTYAFTRTDEYYGIVNEADEDDWLYRKPQLSADQCPYMPVNKRAERERYSNAVKKCCVPSTVSLDKGNYSPSSCVPLNIAHTRPTSAKEYQQAFEREVQDFSEWYKSQCP